MPGGLSGTPFSHPSGVTVRYLWNTVVLGCSLIALVGLAVVFLVLGLGFIVADVFDSARATDAYHNAVTISLGG